MLGQMIEVASECIKHPKRQSVWSYELGRYICPDDPEDAKAVAEAKREAPKTSTRKSAKTPIYAPFKMVFLTAAGGTLLFLVICIVLTFAAGKEPPPLYEKAMMSFFDLAKVGFGAIVGLLGAQSMGNQEGA